MVWLSGCVDCAKLMKPKLLVGAPLVAVNRLEPAAKVAPASVDRKIPDPLTAARTVVEGEDVSSFRSLMNPPMMDCPLLNEGALFPKLIPPLMERNSPLLVATSRTLEAGRTIRLIPRVLSVEPPTSEHVSPPSIDL